MILRGDLSSPGPQGRKRGPRAKKVATTALTRTYSVTLGLELMLNEFGNVLDAIKALFGRHFIL